MRLRGRAGAQQDLGVEQRGGGVCSVGRRARRACAKRAFEVRGEVTRARELKMRLEEAGHLPCEANARRRPQGYISAASPARLARDHLEELGGLRQVERALRVRVEHLGLVRRVAQVDGRQLEHQRGRELGEVVGVERHAADRAHVHLRGATRWCRRDAAEMPPRSHLERRVGVTDDVGAAAVGLTAAERGGGGGALLGEDGAAVVNLGRLVELAGDGRDELELRREGGGRGHHAVIKSRGRPSCINVRGCTSRLPLSLVELALCEQTAHIVLKQLVRALLERRRALERGGRR